MDRIVIHTNWTNTVQEVTTLALDDLLDGAKRDILPPPSPTPSA